MKNSPEIERVKFDIAFLEYSLSTLHMCMDAFPEDEYMELAADYESQLAKLGEELLLLMLAAEAQEYE